jgi:hypothetical protein
MISDIFEVFIWIVGGLFIAVVMLLSYALMSINSSTQSYEDELIEFQQLNKTNHEKTTTDNADRAAVSRMHDTKEVQ